MKYAFMSFSCPKATFPEMLAMAREYGYDGVEPRIGSGHAHGVELAATADARRRFRRQAEEAGVAICCVATSCRFAEPESAPKFLDELRQAIDLSGDIGAPRIRVFGGKLGEGLTRQEAIKLVTESLAGAADQAAGRGVTLCMETHDEWTDPSHVAQVMRQVSHPAVAVNWDIMHPVRFAEWSMDDAFEAVRPWVRHVHFHDAMKNHGWRLCPIGDGEIDHRRAVELLLTHGYDGYLSGEWISWQPPEEHLPRELATMKRYEKESSAR